ncbi:MAG TPA: response regulator transcription factor [Candidatus Dormibacteraeota bacterium]|jgi:DNA-binding NarL/FixJ family response regulator|nr:response regulator transcription factor [Candidatus Dormibacteraeota bacterium]
MPTRSVLVVARSHLARSGLEALVQRGSRLTLVGAAGPQTAAEECERLEPDAVVVEAGEDTEELVGELLRTRSEPVVVALSGRDAAPALLAAGAAGVLASDARAEEIEAAVVAAGVGLAVLSASALGVLMPEAPSAEVEAPVETLTPRESEVLQLLSQGLTNPRIAARLGVSEHTVKFHVTSLMGKLSARTRAEAVARAMRLGWVLV